MSDFEVNGSVLMKYVGLGGDVIIPDGITEIKYQAFFCCKNISSIVIPSSVTKIGESAFEGCEGVATITIPDSVKVIGMQAFSGWNASQAITILSSDIKFEVGTQYDFDVSYKADTFTDCTAFIYAPNVPFAAFSRYSKTVAVSGFCHQALLGNDAAYSDRAEYVKYIKNQRKRLVRDCLHEIPDLLDFLCSEKLLTLDDIEQCQWSISRDTTKRQCELVMEYKANLPAKKKQKK